MPQSRLVRAFVALWWVLAAVLLLLSIQTVRSAVSSGASGTDHHALVLGAIEAIAAVLFMVPRTLRVGGIGLLITIGVAFLVHALRGHFAAPLLIYAAGVHFVMIHGPVPVGAPWRKGSQQPV